MWVGGVLVSFSWGREKGGILDRRRAGLVAGSRVWHLCPVPFRKTGSVCSMRGCLVHEGVWVQLHSAWVMGVIASTQGGC